MPIPKQCHHMENIVRGNKRGKLPPKSPSYFEILRKSKQQAAGRKVERKFKFQPPMVNMLVMVIITSTWLLAELKASLLFALATAFVAMRSSDGGRVIVKLYWRAAPGRLKLRF